MVLFMASTLAETGVIIRCWPTIRKSIQIKSIISYNIICVFIGHVHFIYFVNIFRLMIANSYMDSRLKHWTLIFDINESGCNLIQWLHLEQTLIGPHVSQENRKAFKNVKLCFILCYVAIFIFLFFRCYEFFGLLVTHCNMKIKSNTTKWWK